MTKSAGRNDPWVAFRFTVSLLGMGSGGFSEVSGFQSETAVHDQPEGGVNDHVWKFPMRTTYPNLVLKRGAVDNLLWLWYAAVTQGSVQRLDGTIFVYSGDMSAPAMVWLFRQAFPSKWIGPELRAKESNVAVETLELTHQGLIRMK